AVSSFWSMRTRRASRRASRASCAASARAWITSNDRLRMNSSRAHNSNSVTFLRIASMVCPTSYFMRSSASDCSRRALSNSLDSSFMSSAFSAAICNASCAVLSIALLRLSYRMMIAPMAITMVTTEQNAITHPESTTIGSSLLGRTPGEFVARRYRLRSHLRRIAAARPPPHSVFVRPAGRVDADDMRRELRELVVGRFGNLRVRAAQCHGEVIQVREEVGRLLFRRGEGTRPFLDRILNDRHRRLG